MPAKNRAFDNNDDLDDMFGEDALMGGDQGAPPGGSDEFGEGEIFKGDQAGAPEDSVDFNPEDEDDGDEDDKAFMAEISKPKV